MHLDAIAVNAYRNTALPRYDLGMTEDEQVGATVARLRRDKSLSQAELSTLLRARGLAWSQGTLSKVEAGQRPVRLVEAPVLGSALGVDSSALLEGDMLADRPDEVRRELVQAREELAEAQDLVTSLEDCIVALHLFALVRDGRAGGVKVTAGGPASIVIDALEGESPTDWARLRLLRSIGQPGLADQIEQESESAVAGWLECEDAVPEYIADEFDDEDVATFLLERRALAARGVESAERHLVSIEVSLRARDELALALGMQVLFEQPSVRRDGPLADAIVWPEGLAPDLIAPIPDAP